jgi:SHS2 domain-containing protein
MQFEVLDISGDVGIKVYGASLQNAFINAGVGLYHLITDINQVDEKKTIRVAINAETIEGLLICFLNELIFQFDAHNFIGKTIEMFEFSNTLLTAIIRGEDFDPDKHEQRMLVKAATYHKLAINEKDLQWEIQVIFDI